MATRYVNLAAAAGGDGSLATPWQTLAAAVTGSTAGDTVLVAPGTTGIYTETTALTENKGLLWVATNAVWAPTVGTVTIKSTGNSRVLRLYTATSWTGFIFDAAVGAAAKSNLVETSADSVNHTFTDCVFTNSDATTTNATVVSANNAGMTVTFTRCTWSNVVANTYGVYVGDSDFIFTDCNVTAIVGTWCYIPGNGTGKTVTITRGTFTPTGATYFVRNRAAHTLSVSGANITLVTANALCFDLSASSSATISNVTFNATTASVKSFVQNATANKTGTIIVEDCDITYAVKSALPIIYLDNGSASGGHTVVIRRNTIRAAADGASYSMISVTDQADVTITWNQLYSLDAVLTDSQTFANIFVTSVNMLTAPVTITYNTIYTKRWTGYTLAIGDESGTPPGGWATPLTVEHNTIYGPWFYKVDPAGNPAMNHAIILYMCAGSVRYNRVYGCGYGVICKGVSTFSFASGVIAYNLFWDNQQCGILAKGAVNVYAHNNTVVKASTLAGVSTEGMAVRFNGVVGNSASMEAINNIVYMVGGTRLIRVGDGATDTNSTLVSGTNMVYSPDGSAACQAYGISQTWAQWQAAGYDTDSFNVNPLMQNPYARNCALKRYSPAKNRGFDMDETLDIVGKRVPQLKNPSIGAWE